MGGIRRAGHELTVASTPTRSGRIWALTAVLVVGVFATACGTSGRPTAASLPTTGAVAPVATTGRSSTTTSTATQPVPNGSYLMTSTPDCGEVSVNAARILVGGSTDSIVLAAGGELAHGAITGSPGSFHIQAANGSALTIDLTGTVGADGVLTGSGKSGGIYPGGQNGWVCQFTFTASSSSTPTTVTTAPTTTPAIPTSSVPDFFSPSMNIGCELDYGRTGVPDQAYCQTFMPPQSVTMTTTGSFTPCTGDNCVGNPGEDTPTLAYGQASAVGPFICVSATSGVTCTVSGRGFQISKSGITAVGG